MEAGDIADVLPEGGVGVGVGFDFGGAKIGQKGLELTRAVGDGFSKPSMRRQVCGPSSVWRCAAPVISNGEPSARERAATAVVSSRPESVIVAVWCDAGKTLSASSVITPRVPKLPAISLTRS